MHRELLDALSVITEEEQRILDEQRGIDPQLYTEKKELIVDSEKLLKKGKLIQVRPHTRFVNFPKHKHNYVEVIYMCCLLYTSPSPRDYAASRMPSSA